VTLLLNEVIARLINKIVREIWLLYSDDAKTTKKTKKKPVNRKSNAEMANILRSCDGGVNLLRPDQGFCSHGRISQLRKLLYH